MKRNFQLPLLLLLLTSCTWLGLPQPQTFNQRAAVAIGSVTSIRQSATALLTAKKLSADDAENINTQADSAMAGIAIARQIYATDPNGGETRLTVIITTLTAIQGYLDAKQKGSP